MDSSETDIAILDERLVADGVPAGAARELARVVAANKATVKSLHALASDDGSARSFDAVLQALAGPGR